MNFLQLCQRVCEDGGISGSPTTVVGQTGELKRVVNWVGEAWRKIQVEQDGWLWMRTAGSTALAIGVSTFTTTTFGATRFKNWYQYNFRIYTTALGVSDESALYYLDYDTFRNQYLFGTPISGRPMHVTVAPDDSVIIGPVPDLAYTVKGEYQKSAQTMSVDADTPEFQTDYHMAIVYRALMFYGTYEAADDVYNPAKKNFADEIERIEMRELPQMQIVVETLVQ